MFHRDPYAFRICTMTTDLQTLLSHCWCRVLSLLWTRTTGISSRLMFPVAQSSSGCSPLCQW